MIASSRPAARIRSRMPVRPWVERTADGSKPCPSSDTLNRRPRPGPSSSEACTVMSEPPECRSALWMASVQQK